MKGEVDDAVDNLLGSGKFSVSLLCRFAIYLFKIFLFFPSKYFVCLTQCLFLKTILKIVAGSFAGKSPNESKSPLIAKQQVQQQSQSSSKQPFAQTSQLIVKQQYPQTSQLSTKQSLPKSPQLPAKQKASNLHLQEQLKEEDVGVKVVQTTTSFPTTQDSSLLPDLSNIDMMSLPIDIEEPEPEINVEDVPYVT